MIKEKLPGDLVLRQFVRKRQKCPFQGDAKNISIDKKAVSHYNK